MEAGYALAGVISLILNLILPEESEKHEFMTEAQTPRNGPDLETGVTTAVDTGVNKGSFGLEEKTVTSPEGSSSAKILE